MTYTRDNIKSVESRNVYGWTKDRRIQFLKCDVVLETGERKTLYTAVGSGEWSDKKPKLELILG